MERTTIEITESDYRTVRDLLARRTGLNFPESKREELITVLQDRMAVLARHQDPRAYVDNLEREADGGLELRGLVSRLTVGETYFFRNRAQFAALRADILPEIIHRNRGKGRRLRMWSAGCSTGEEPYSLAILLSEVLPDLASWEIHILATDINEDALAAARDGLYRSWSFREVEEHYRHGYFISEGEGFRVRPEFKDLVTFHYLNLAEDVYPSAVTGTEEIDLILCRNVMIYFKSELCVEITRRFFSCLDDGGYLLVGHSEHSDLVYPGFSRKFHGRTIVYRKSGPNPVWEKGLAPRFRGSGPPPPGMITHAPPDVRKSGIQRPPGTEETVCFERAVVLVAEMRYAEAVREFKRVLEINPRNERALYSISIMLANTGDNAGAETWATRLVQVNPLHLEGTYLLAIIARETGNRDRELAYLKKTVYLNPDFVLGHFQMGVYCLKAGNEHQARRSFRNVLRLLRGKESMELVEGVDGMTVGRLHETVIGMIPGGAPPEDR